MKCWVGKCSAPQRSFNPLSTPMEHSTFICPVANEEAFKNAVRDVIMHDTTTPVKLGEYTEAEFRSLDPERAEFMLSLKKMFDYTTDRIAFGVRNRSDQKEHLRMHSP